MQKKTSKTHLVESPKQGIEYWVYNANTVGLRGLRPTPLWYVKAYDKNGKKIDQTSSLVHGFHAALKHAKKLAKLDEYPSTGLYYVV